MNSITGADAIAFAGACRRSTQRRGAAVLACLAAVATMMSAAVAAADANPLYAERFSMDVSPAVPLFARLRPDTNDLVIGTFNERLVISVIDAATGEVKRTLDPRPLATGTAMYVSDSPDGRFVAYWATISDEAVVNIVDVDAGTDVGRIDPPGLSQPVLALSSEGKRLAIAGRDGKLRLWDVERSDVIATVSASSVEQVTLSPDGRSVLLTALELGSGMFNFSWYGHALLVDLDAGQLRFSIDEKDNAYWGATFSPDARFFVTSNRGDVRKEDNRGVDAITVRDTATGSVVRSFGIGSPSRGLAAFNHDGSRVLAIADDFSIRVLDVGSGSQVARLTGHGGGSAKPHIPVFTRVRTQQGGASFVSFGIDGKIRVWDDVAVTREMDRKGFESNLAAAQANDVEAMFGLAIAYRDGRGVERNAALAMSWLERAADGGHGPANLELADALLTGDGGRQDCAAGGQRLNRAVTSGSAEAGGRLDAVLSPLGGRDGAAALTPQIQADLLEAQIIEVLTRQDYPAFLANLCALEALGHADRLPIEARRELIYHRAAGLRAAGKPRAALAALNQYLNEAGNTGASYTAAIQMLRPLQEEAK